VIKTIPEIDAYKFGMLVEMKNRLLKDPAVTEFLSIDRDIAALAEKHNLLDTRVTIVTREKEFAVGTVLDSESGQPIEEVTPEVSSEE
jgi:hypothetical protein